MTKKRRTAGRPRPAWNPLSPASIIPPSRERILTVRAAAVERGADPDAAERLALRSQEAWKNDLYTVIVTREPDGFVSCLSVRRNDRGPEVPWRDLQRIKSQLAGDDAEAVELYPSEERLMDTANQRWLWCYPPGFRLPIGFHGGRNVATPEEAAAVGAVQAELPR